MKFIVSLLESSGGLSVPVGIFAGAMMANQLNGGDIQVENLLNAMVLALIVGGVRLLFGRRRRRQ